MRPAARTRLRLVRARLAVLGEQLHDGVQPLRLRRPGRHFRSETSEGRVQRRESWPTWRGICLRFNTLCGFPFAAGVEGVDVWVAPEGPDRAGVHDEGRVRGARLVSIMQAVADARASIAAAHAAKRVGFFGKRKRDEA